MYKKKQNYPHFSSFFPFFVKREKPGLKEPKKMVSWIRQTMSGLVAAL